MIHLWIYSQPDTIFDILIFRFFEKKNFVEIEAKMAKMIFKIGNDGNFVLNGPICWLIGSDSFRFDWSTWKNSVELFA